MTGPRPSPDPRRRLRRLGAGVRARRPRSSPEAGIPLRLSERGWARPAGSVRPRAGYPADVRRVEDESNWPDCDPRACPCPEGDCTLSRYTRAADPAERSPGAKLTATERAVAKRLAGMDVDLSAMAALQNLYRATNAVRNHFEQTVLAPHQLTWTGWIVLWVVWIWEEIETGQVAAEAGIAKGTLTGVVKTLESRGVVQRHHHPEDGRRVLLRLTPAGRRLMSTVFPDFNREETAVTTSLGVDGTSELARLLRTLVLDLDR
jgi:MarR family transcriptional regulator, organic hydroperoxide resistance regulator